MNKDQLARLERHRKVKQVLADNAPAVASVPAFARLTTRFLEQLALLDGMAQRNAVTSEGATLAKTTAGAALIARLVKAANALYLFYKAEPNLEEAAKMHRHPSDYANMTGLEVATEARALSQRVDTHQAALSDYNITPADVAALAADAQSYDALLSAPQLAIDAGKIKGATAKTTLSALNRFLKDEFRAGMELLKDSQPEAYKALREASQVDDAGYGIGKSKRAGREKVLSLALAPGLKSAFVQVPGPPVWLVLTVNTVCNWDFSFPPGPNSSQPPRLPSRRIHKFADDPATLVGQASTWELQVTNLATAEQPYDGEVQLVQGDSADAGTEVYSEGIPADTLPAAPSNPAIITGTVTFYAA